MLRGYQRCSIPRDITERAMLITSLAYGTVYTTGRE